MVSPVEMYRANCQAVGVAMNSALLKGLPETDEKLRNTKVMHFGRNFLGDRGILPLIPVIKRAKSLHTLNLRDNGIGNEGVKALCRHLRGHPSLRVLELGGNPFTYLAARQLTHLFEYNGKITSIGVDDTLMTEPLRQSIVNRMQATMKRREQRKSRQQASRTVMGDEGEEAVEDGAAAEDTRPCEDDGDDDSAVDMALFLSENPGAARAATAGVVTEFCKKLMRRDTNSSSAGSGEAADAVGDEMTSGPSPSASSAGDTHVTVQANDEEEEVMEPSDVSSFEEQKELAAMEESNDIDGDDVGSGSVHSAEDDASGSMVDELSESSVGGDDNEHSTIDEVD